MNYLLTQTSAVRIAYYSGTGCTAKVAGTLQNQLEKIGIMPKLQPIRKNLPFEAFTEDILIILYAVYAMNAPSCVYEWIEAQPSVSGKKAVVISVSGGGETFPNRACRAHCIKRLEKKGFEVVYERMIVMPSNWVIATPIDIATALINILPERTASIISDLRNGVVRRSKPGLLDRGISAVGESEKGLSKKFASNLRISETCTGCGICAKSCPNDNIQMQQGRPVFGKNCLVCMNCLYICPNRSLSPKHFKLFFIKEGFSLKKLEEIAQTHNKTFDKHTHISPAFKAAVKYLSEK